MGGTSLQQLYGRMVLIRRLEETLLELFSLGKLVGTTHTYIGQEANAVGVIDHLDPAHDVVFSNHRCHGHYLAFTDDVDGLLGEVMGRVTGTCGGKGGSQHLCNGNFYSNGVQGSIVPVATGMAVAEKERGTGAVTVVFLGDGTLGQGTVYECLNLASLWSLPILFVVENNHYAQTTPRQLAVAGSIPDRALPFGIASSHLDTTDVLEVQGGGRADDRRRPGADQTRVPGRRHVPLQPALERRRHARSLRDRSAARARSPDGRGGEAAGGRARIGRGRRERSSGRSTRGGESTRRRQDAWRSADALRRGSQRGVARGLRAARGRRPHRRGRPRSLRRRVQDHARPERALA